MPEFLFAYGTLQPGLARPEMAALVARMEPVGRGSVAGTLYDLGEYPGAVLTANAEANPGAHSARRVHGTVLRLPEQPGFLRELDAYEEFYPAAQELSQFVRVLQAVDLDRGGSLNCWIYVYNWPFAGARVIESGTYEVHGELRKLNYEL